MLILNSIFVTCHVNNNLPKLQIIDIIEEVRGDIFTHKNKFL